MFSKTLFINLILAAMILLGTWYTWQQLTRTNHIFTERHERDSYATQVIMFHTDADGNLHDQLKTPLSVHYPLDDTISLALPIFDVFLKNDDTWQLTAKYGKLKAGNDHLLLWDNVKLIQKKGSNANIASTLTTSILNINLKEKTADTSSPVTIIQANQVLNAVGLHADFNTKTIQLLSQVKGQLKPSQSK